MEQAIRGRREGFAKDSKLWLWCQPKPAMLSILFVLDSVSEAAELEDPGVVLGYP